MITGLFFSAVITLVVSLVDFAQLGGILHWLMGSLGIVGYRAVGVIAVGTAVGTAMIYAQARALNVLALGEESALQLGVEAERVKRIVFVASSLLTGVIVAQTGPIGFVGLIVPHGVRLLIGADNRLLLPVAAGGGAAFLVLADTLARDRRAAGGAAGGRGHGVLRRAVLRLSPADPPAAARSVSAPLSGVRGVGRRVRLRRRVPPGRRVVRGRRGRDHGVVGPNSSGKTTLLRLLSKVHAPDRGEIRFRGRPLGAVARLDLARDVAVVPQEEQLAFPVSVEELVLMGRFPRSEGRLFEGPADLARAREAMSLAGVLELSDHLSTRSRAESASARCSRARSPRSRECSSWTSRRAISTSSISGSSSASSAS